MAQWRNATNIPQTVWICQQEKTHFINKLNLSFKSIYNISSFIAPLPPKHQRKPLLCLPALRLQFQRLHKMIFCIIITLFLHKMIIFEFF